MKLEQLISLAETDPLELCLLFAREIAGYPEALQTQFGIISSPDMISHRFLRDYLTDFSAVFQSAKDKGIACEVEPWAIAQAWRNGASRDKRGNSKVYHHRPEWDSTPTVPLMICILAVWGQMEGETK